MIREMEMKIRDKVKKQFKNIQKERASGESWTRDLVLTKDVLDPVSQTEPELSFSDFEEPEFFTPRVLMRSRSNIQTRGRSNRV